MTDADNRVLPRHIRAVAQLDDAPGDDVKRAEAQSTLHRARPAFVVP